MKRILLIALLSISSFTQAANDCEPKAVAKYADDVARAREYYIEAKHLFLGRLNNEASEILRLGYDRKYDELCLRYGPLVRSTNDLKYSIEFMANHFSLIRRENINSGFQAPEVIRYQKIQNNPFEKYSEEVVSGLWNACHDNLVDRNERVANWFLEFKGRTAELETFIRDKNQPYMAQLFTNAKLFREYKNQCQEQYKALIRRPGECPVSIPIIEETSVMTK